MKITDSTSKRIPLLFLSIIFLIRLLFGVSSKFWSVDELQIYRLGVSFFSEGTWPFFGPDVVYSGSKIPGALQAFLVGIPFYILRIPEAPFIFVNILSFVSLVFFGTYLKRLFPKYSSKMLWSWLSLAPWTLIFSTHVINPSYVLPAAIVFWIAFLEITYQKTFEKLSINQSFLLMGAALGWIYQLHMSWVLLPPCIGFAWIVRKENRTVSSFCYACLGLLIFGSLAIPTFFHQSTFASTASNVHFEPLHLLQFFQICIRFISYGTFFLVGSFGSDAQARMDFFAKNWWIAPFYFATAIGVLTQVSYVVLWLCNNIRHHKLHDLRLVYIVASVLLLTTTLFVFSIKAPSAHAFYLLLPLSCVFIAHVFHNRAQSQVFQASYALIFCCNLVVVCALLGSNLFNRSMYRDRDRVVRAIEMRDADLLTERRL